MFANPAFDAALLRRYDARRSACTGYPGTAARLSPAFGPEALRDAVRMSNGDPIPRRLGLHLHLPYARDACRACGLRGIDAQEPQDPVADSLRLEREIEHLAPFFDADREVVQVQFAGALLESRAVQTQIALLGRLRQAFRLLPEADIEAVVEVPAEGCSPEGLRELIRAGFNRLRLAGPNPVACATALALCRGPGLRGVGVDLSYGAPGQSDAALEGDLAALRSTRPDRVGLFPAQQPADLHLLQHAGNALSEMGHVYLGLDQFARPEDPLARAQARGGLHANLLGYTTQADTEVIGIGVGALSRIGDSVALNFRSSAAWRMAVDAGRLPVSRGRRLTEDDELRAQMVEPLACDAAVAVRLLEQRYGIDFRRRFAAALEQLAPLLEDGLATLTPDTLRVSTQGRLLLGHIAACFNQK